MGNLITYCHVILVNIDGVWIGNRIYCAITTRSYKDYALTVLHTSQITVEHTKYSQSVRVFTSRCLVAVYNNGRSPSSGFPNYHRPQLPASNSNSSQQLNPSGYVIN
jgi:hypothetical protein